MSEARCGRLLLLGATGGIGRATLELALRRRLAVTAFVRSPERVAEFAEHIEIVRGDPLDPVALARVVPGHDAILSSLGPRSFGPTTVITDAARSIIGAVPAGTTPRVVFVSAAIVFRNLGPFAAVLRATLLRHVAADASAAEALLRASRLRWSALRPPRLHDGPATPQWRVAVEAMPPRARFAMSRRDVAACMLDELQRPEHIGCVLGLARTRGAG